VLDAVSQCIADKLTNAPNKSLLFLHSATAGMQWRVATPLRRAVRKLHQQQSSYQAVSASKALDQPREPILDDGEWGELLEQTQLRAIRIDSGTLEGDLRAGLVVDEQSYTAIYVEGAEGLKNNCEPAHAKIPCGKCYAALNESWGIEYFWTDHTIVPRTTERVEAGELSWNEFDATVAAEVLRCRTEGYAKIGYSYTDPG